MTRQTRQSTNRILQMVEEGVLDRDLVILACLKYMSEDDVTDMAHANEFFTADEEEEDSDEGSDDDDDEDDSNDE